MSETLNIRDVDPETKAILVSQAAQAGVSLAAYVRSKLDEIAGKQQRISGSLSNDLGNIGEPDDGWGPMSEADLANWEAQDEWPAT